MKVGLHGKVTRILLTARIFLGRKCVTVVKGGVERRERWNRVEGGRSGHKAERGPLWFVHV